MVDQYNCYMVGVDKSNQLLSYFCHCTVKWWKKGFFHLLDMAVVNAICFTQLLSVMAIH